VRAKGVDYAEQAAKLITQLGQRSQDTALSQLGVRSASSTPSHLYSLGARNWKKASGALNVL